MSESFPARVRRYIALLVVVAAASWVGVAVMPVDHVDPHALLALPMLAMLAAAASMVLMFSFRGQRMALELFEAMLAPALVLFSPAMVVSLAVAAQVAANAARRNHPVKAAFNVAQWTIATGAATALYASLRDARALSPRSLAALAFALTVAAAINGLAFANVLRLLEGHTMRALAQRFAQPLTVGWIVNLAFGVIFVVASVHAPAVVLLFIVPLLVLRWAHASYAAVLADKARLRSLHDASRVLSEPVDPLEALPAFAEAVRACFDADAVEIVVARAGGRAIYGASRRDEPRSSLEADEVASFAAAVLARERFGTITSSERDPLLRTPLLRAGRGACMAAPLVTSGRVIGALCVYDRSGPAGFEDGEEAVLTALANEAAAAIQKGALLGAILEERRKLADVVGKTSDGIMTIDARGVVTMWNAGFERVTGLPSSEMTGARIGDRLRARDGSGEPVPLERWIHARGEFPAAVQITTAAGERRWLSCSYSRVTSVDDDGSVMIVVARDVTKERELERLKDDFVATVSHELRTPLTPIRGWADTLVAHGDRLSPDERNEAARSILAQAQHLERLITSLLQAARIERGAPRAREGLVDARAAASRVVEQFMTEYPSRAFRAEAPSAGCTARGDAVFVEQILSNLLSNAVKYSPQGTPIDVVVRSDDSSISIEVTDAGSGIAEADHERIFERFYRLGDVLTRSTGGSGLGLYVARQLAHALGGTLTVRSAPGDGATFTLALQRATQLESVAS